MTDRTVWLRVDVDTYLGARDGLPRVLDTLAAHDATATFFVSVGPDRWGRAVFRVIRRKGFLKKMLRTGAVQAYGLSTCLRGTLLPSIQIGARLADGLRVIPARGHEVGLHCWDHVRWQDELPSLGPDRVRREVQLGVDGFRSIYGHDPTSWASPGWVSSPDALEVLDGFGFDWMSNSRGTVPFVPRVAGRELRTIDLPTSLSTLDEDLGRDGIREDNYVDHLLESIEETSVPVLVIHTETEGGRYEKLLVDLLTRAREAGYEFRAMGGLAARALAERDRLPRCDIQYAEIPGRAGAVTIQGDR